MIRILKQLYRFLFTNKDEENIDIILNSRHG